MVRPSGGAVLLAILCLVGCGGGDGEGGSRIRGDTLTIYSSGPRHGVSASAGEAVFLGQRQALEEAGGRAGNRRIRLRRLAATRPGDSLWDPGMVKANAERARKDPSAIAYLGELDYGGSAVSLPVTNRAELLQVSPTDGLTSLTRRPPGRPRAGPERYYPRHLRTFARLVPSDLLVAEALAAMRPRGRARRVALLHGHGIADRELATILVNRLRRTGTEPAFMEMLRDDVDAVPGVIDELAASRPDAVFLVGARGPAAPVVVAALARRQRRLPILATPGLSEGALRPAPGQLRMVTPVLPPSAQTAAGRRMLRRLERRGSAPPRPEALYGFAAMRLVLDAIDRAGPDRRGVVRAALSPTARRSVLGRLSLDRRGDVRTTRLAVLRVRDGRAELDRVVSAR